MAVSSLGASNTQILSWKLSHQFKSYTPPYSRSIQAASRPKAWNHASLISQRPNKALIVCRGQSSLVIENESVASEVEDEDEHKSLPHPVSQLIPNSDELNSLLTDICDTTSIAEFELKLNGFHLCVKRALSGGIDPPAQSLPPPVSVSTSGETTVDAAALNGPASTSSLTIYDSGSSGGKTGSLLERAADEGLVIIQSPKVGFFRRSRTVKGKRAPPPCKERQVVKEGQVICYIEQLGGEIPVESDVSGEVTRILREDGEPVGYGDPIIAILPSFPGIKMLQ